MTLNSTSSEALATQISASHTPATNFFDLADADSMSSVLLHRAATTPDEVAFRFLSNGDDDIVEWTYGQLSKHASNIAAKLTQQNPTPTRVLLVLEPGLEYIAALFGIFQAGATAIPSFPPAGSRAVSRLASIYADCDADLIIADASFRAAEDRLNAALAPDGSHPQWLFVDDDFLMHEYAYTHYSIAQENVYTHYISAPKRDPLHFPALLQYTSGSTGEPKGVMLSHANLISNCKVLADRLGQPERHVGFTWLPPYHDMGLMGALLLSVYGGFPLLMMSPAHFVQRPLRWLKAMSKHGVTTSVAPNFALDLCVESVTDEELATLDLSKLTMLFCGAEPVRMSTLERFTQKFGPRGFSASAYVPCYGLAEATLFISGKPHAAGEPRTIHIDKEELARGAIQVTAASDANAHAVVSCGTIAAEHEMLIVDPDTREPVAENEVGEIWFSGASVALGYLNKKEASLGIFKATLAGACSDRTYLRTGDLGFMLCGELFISGRIKDVIIFGGRNLYPQDIEASVQLSHPAIRTNGVAAFSVHSDSSEKLVVVAEIARSAKLDELGLQEVGEAITTAVTRDHGVCPSEIHLAPVSTIPLTTSGKVRRNACREAFVQGALAAVKPRAERLAASTVNQE
ncbi:fatty acyl-AMP ligase [Paraherbaspirillum soli]|uniref:Fatty acyl-AMP ligase n=1 Tax=Paraherbaspirillum soli TaxID=631222 RepID=A0ABW0MCW1_9BURK